MARVLREDFDDVLLESGDGLALEESGGAISFDPSAAQSAASLALSAQTRIPLGPAVATSSASGNLVIFAQAHVLLENADDVLLESGDGLALEEFAAFGQPIPLGAAGGTSNVTLFLSAQTRVPLNTSAATASATMVLFGPTHVVLAASVASASATLVLKTTPRFSLSAAAQSAAWIYLGVAGQATSPYPDPPTSLRLMVPSTSLQVEDPANGLTLNPLENSLTIDDRGTTVELDG